MGRSPDQRANVKLSPITLPASAEVRLRRLAPGATYQADQHRLLMPVPSRRPVPGTGLLPPSLVGPVASWSRRPPAGLGRSRAPVSASR